MIVCVAPVLPIYLAVVHEYLAPFAHRFLCFWDIDVVPTIGDSSLDIVFIIQPLLTPSKFCICRKYLIAEIYSFCIPTNVSF
ncbi:unnamed protein product [Trifolium pratense]|uniref:Uncharacterized protein n=1 Tax=Trifolium pratense TaxID=57577 RepID=A0ACB0L6L9_TRIPR|nr:unnamed protein product [Trifolium pratense]